MRLKEIWKCGFWWGQRVKIDNEDDVWKELHPNTAKSFELIFFRFCSRVFIWSHNDHSRRITDREKWRKQDIELGKQRVRKERRQRKMGVEETERWRQCEQESKEVGKREQESKTGRSYKINKERKKRKRLILEANNRKKWLGSGKGQIIEEITTCCISIL